MNVRALLLPIPLLLAGCGVVAAFVPPIEVGDALGVEGRSLTTTFGADTAGLAAQEVSSADASVERTFDDVELDLRGFSLAELRAGIGLDPTVVVTAPSALSAFPESFTLTSVSATATVSDEVNGSATMRTGRSVDLTFALDAGSCTLGACSYRYDGDTEALVDVLSIATTRADGDTLASFVDVVRLDGTSSTNTGSFSMSVEADSEPGLDGFSATFTLRSGGTVIELGG